MKKEPRKNRVLMANSVLANSFYKLNEGNIEEKELYSFINRAMDDLAKDPFCGIKIRSQQWPKDYIKKHQINNLRKYDLPKGWRLIYTIRGSEIEIVSIILEWMSHKEYERRFNY